MRFTFMIITAMAAAIALTSAASAQYVMRQDANGKMVRVKVTQSHGECMRVAMGPKFRHPRSVAKTYCDGRFPNGK